MMLLLVIANFLFVSFNGLKNRLDDAMIGQCNDWTVQCIPLFKALMNDLCKLGDWEKRETQRSFSHFQHFFIGLC